mgnify:CR=1 FL=1
MLGLCFGAASGEEQQRAQWKPDEGAPRAERMRSQTLQLRNWRAPRANKRRRRLGFIEPPVAVAAARVSERASRTWRRNSGATGSRGREEAGELARHWAARVESGDCEQANARNAPESRRSDAPQPAGRAAAAHLARRSHRGSARRASVRVEREEKPQPEGASKAASLPAATGAAERRAKLSFGSELQVPSYELQFSQISSLRSELKLYFELQL